MIKRKEPTWDELGVAMQQFGWSMSKTEKSSVIFERGRQRIVVRKIEEDNWKVEYYSGSILDDMAGITGSRFAKIETMEMGISK